MIYRVYIYIYIYIFTITFSSIIMIISIPNTLKINEIDAFEDISEYD